MTSVESTGALLAILVSGASGKGWGRSDVTDWCDEAGGANAVHDMQQIYEGPPTRQASRAQQQAYLHPVGNRQQPE
eukprot:6175010-Pleurochrysis_carterae.AAC.1